MDKYAELKQQRDELQAAFNEAMRVLDWVLLELQSMEAGADPNFRKFLGKLKKEAKKRTIEKA